MRQLNFLNHEISSVHAAALILGAAGLLSRLLGVLRDRLLAAEFGAGRELDIYYAAFQIPDFMSVLFLLGAASAAILPIFQKYLLEDRQKARDFIAGLTVVFFIGAGLAAVAAFFAAPLLVRLVAPGFSASEREFTTILTRLMLVSPILFGLSGIFSVVIQSFGRFFVYALAPVLYNLGIIIGIAFLVPIFGIYGLGFGVGLGALAHFLLQFGSSVRLGFRPTVWSGTPNSWVGVRRVIALSFPRVLAMSFTQLTGLILVAIGSAMAEGSVAVFNLSQNLAFVPIGIFGVSYATALFPRLSAAALRHSGEDFFRELFIGVRSILFWVAPSAALFLVLRAHIVRVALGGGVFSWEDTRLTAAVLAALAVSMAAVALQTVLIRGFYALGNTWTPLAVNAAASVFSVGLAVGTGALLSSPAPAGRGLATLFRIADLPHPEVLGLGIGFAAGAIVNSVLLYILLLRRASTALRAASDTGSGGESWKIIAAAIAAAGVGYLVRASFSETLPLITFIRVLAQGIAAAAAGAAAYAAILTVLGSEELQSLRRSAVRRLFSVGILPKSWES